MKASETQIADLFCGPGGMSLGFGHYFDITLAVDKERDPCKTYLHNISNAVRQRDVMDLTGCRNDFDGITAIISGPPCKPFSELNLRKDPNDPRIHLWKGIMDFAEMVQPAFIVIENVPTIFVYVKEAIIKRAEELGYYVTTVIVDASDYSVPQSRRRWMLIATKRPFVFPKPTCQLPLTVANAITQIPDDLNIGHSNPRPETIAKLQGIPQGKWVATTPGGFKNTIWLEWDKPSPTVVNIAKVRMIHPSGVRLITETEAAKLQDFPIVHKFFGNKRSRCQQIADAAPQSLMRELARALCESQFKTECKN